MLHPRRKVQLPGPPAVSIEPLRRRPDISEFSGIWLMRSPFCLQLFTPRKHHRKPLRELKGAVRAASHITGAAARGRSFSQLDEN